MKKILKIVGILLLVFIIAIASVPFLFKDTIQDKIQIFINDQVHAKVNFEDVDISLLRSFPQASVVIQELSIINHAPFEGDTLVYAKKIALDMSVKELFKDASETISLQKIIINEANIAIKTDSLGNSNLDITKKEDNIPVVSEKEEESSSFTFALDHYELNNSKVLFRNDVSKIVLEITDINHSGDGSVSGEKIILDTKSTSKASFLSDGTKYLNNHSLSLDALLELDLENQRYAFQENKAMINKLPLKFTGYVQLFEKYTEIDLSFKTPNSDFKNFLAVIPETYAKNLDGVQTSGDFSIKGVIKGKVDDTYIPKMDIQITSNNASFKYPELPKSVTNININTEIKNETGLVDDTFINIENLTFRIDQDIFALKGSLRNLTKNMIVDMALKGTLNLENLDKAYPLQLEQKLNGIVKANVKTHFDMESLDKEQYQNIKSEGTIRLDDFTYASADLPNEIKIKNADVGFNPTTITLNSMQVTTGKSDLAAQGTINNLMGFLFAKQDLKGNFDVNSNLFAVDDFMMAETDTTSDSTNEEKTEGSSPTEEALKIPSFLDATLNFDAKKVLYDNLVLHNTKGTVIIKDETAYLKNVTSSIFDGGISFDGNVSTKTETPTFKMALDLSNIDIVKSFNGLDMIKGIAPIAKALNGALSTKINLNGNLKNDLTPVLTSLKGTALAEILNAQVSTAQAPLLSKLDNQLNFIDLNNTTLKNIKTNLSFDDGKINVKPFDIDIKGIKITAGGSHSFDTNMNYNVTMDVPAKYLGNEAQGLISQLSEQEKNSMTIGVPIGISGTFTDPKINLNTKAAVNQLTQQILSKQKEKAKDQLVGKGTEVLSDLLGNSKKKQDTTNTTQNTEDKLKDAAKNVLGGLFGNKKKKDTTKTKN